MMTTPTDQDIRDAAKALIPFYGPEDLPGAVAAFLRASGWDEDPSYATHRVGVELYGWSWNEFDAERGGQE